MSQADDQVTILVSGDAVDLAFTAPKPLPDGWTRTYFLRVTGWAKEANFHNRTGPWIAPLPHARMKRYPPQEAVERDASYNDYIRKYQTRWVER